MEAILTVRLDANTKELGTKVMQECGMSPSQAVRKLFDYAVLHDSLPFSESDAGEDDVFGTIRAFDSCHTKEPLNMTDEEIREERLRSSI